MLPLSFNVIGALCCNADLLTTETELCFGQRTNLLGLMMSFAAIHVVIYRNFD